MEVQVLNYEGRVTEVGFQFGGRVGGWTWDSGKIGLLQCVGGGNLQFLLIRRRSVGGLFEGVIWYMWLSISTSKGFTVWSYTKINITLKCPCCTGAAVVERLKVVDLEQRQCYPMEHCRDVQGLAHDPH